MGKRALVVDDSKSSRLFLGKLLLEQQLQVDEVDSAEAAIDYLGRNSPDVIFMDHLMPGMDGFQAVQAIKANPRTAQIPILMYTSQEGELYLGQAQALGVAGVVAKGTTQPQQLATVLGSLWGKPALESSIVVEPPASAQQAEPCAAQPPEATVASAPAATIAAAPAAATSAPVVSANLPEAWRSEISALREQVTLALNAQRTALSSDLRTLLREAQPAPAMRPEEPRHSPLAWVLTVIAVAGAAVLGTLYWQGDQQRAALRAELADSREAVALLTARLAPPPEPEPQPVPGDAESMPASGAAELAGNVAQTAAVTAAPASAAVPPTLSVAQPAAAVAVHAVTVPAAPNAAGE